MIEVVLGQLIKQLAIGVVGQRIFAARGRLAGIEIDVRSLEVIVLHLAQGLAEVVDGLVHALEIQVSRFAALAL